MGSSEAITARMVQHGGDAPCSGGLRTKPRHLALRKKARRSRRREASSGPGAVLTLYGQHLFKSPRQPCVQRNADRRTGAQEGHGPDPSSHGWTVAGQEGIYSPVCLVPKAAAVPGHSAPAKPAHPGSGLSVPTSQVLGSFIWKEEGAGLGHLRVPFQLQPLRVLGQI